MKNNIMHKIAIIQTNQPNNIALPTQIASILKIQDGDTVYFATVNDDSVRLFTKQSSFYKQLESANAVMEEDKEALKLLAK